jgi:protein-L-isoaspartate(D-aspartate) O-methyltransferase
VGTVSGEYTDEMKFQNARERMVETQLVARGIRDPHVLDAMRRIPRHMFIEEGLQERAYGDYPLPIGEGQTISQPYIVASMTELLALKGDERVLEIGTGSGYQTAILAELAAQVFTIERISSISERARIILDRLGYRNIIFRIGDGSIGWREFSPYHGIMVTAASPEVPQSLAEQLAADGGRMVIPIGPPYSQDLVVVERRNNTYHKTVISGCVFVPLIGRHGWKE